MPENTHDQPSADAGDRAFSTTKSEQPSKRSHEGVEQRGDADARVGGEKNHRRRVDAGEARKNAR